MIDIDHGIKVGIFFKELYMETKFLEKPRLPQFLPHGWKSEVAKVLGVSPITVRRNLQQGKGEVYNKIVRAAAAKYGEKKEIAP